MDNLTRFSALVEATHPDAGLESFFQRLRARTAVKILRHTPYITDWYPSLDDPLMLRILQAHTRICEKVARPYLCRGLSPAARHRALIGQYRWLRAHLSEEALSGIFLGEGLELARLSLGEDGEHWLALRHLDQFEMEGDLTLSLMRSEGVRIFSLTFSVLDEAGGLRVQIGGVQGGADMQVGRVGSIEEIVKQLTKAWHGMRPKALVLCALMDLARSWGAVRLSGVGRDYHVCHELSLRRRRKHPIHTDYDSLWLDVGGSVDVAFPHLYALPLTWPIKSLEAVSAHKRSMYRRRYAMLEMLHAELACQARAALRDGLQGACVA